MHIFHNVAEGMANSVISMPNQKHPEDLADAFIQPVNQTK